MISIIVIGAGIIVYPWLNALYFDYMQRRLINNWNEATVSAESSADTVADSRPVGRGDWIQSVAVIGGSEADDSVWDEEINPTFDMPFLLDNMQGTIVIERIRLRAPILNRVTEYGLNLAICSVVERRSMGQSGNYVLSGHRSRIRGRHFSRINELKRGDEIILDNGTESFVYTVTEVFTVSASDVWVMHDEGDRKLLTLITCYYGVTPTGRLIVRAELSDD